MSCFFVNPASCDALFRRISITLIYAGILQFCEEFTSGFSCEANSKYIDFYFVILPAHIPFLSLLIYERCFAIVGHTPAQLGLIPFFPVQKESVQFLAS